VRTVAIFASLLPVVFVSLAAEDDQPTIAKKNQNKNKSKPHELNKAIER
jgi:hypothetical protein